MDQARKFQGNCVEILSEKTGSRGNNLKPPVMAWAGSGFNEPWNELTHRNCRERSSRGKTKWPGI